MTPTKPKEKNALPPVTDLSYEQALAELESIVASLESNQLPLEATMALYERGQQLTRHCVELLDKAELRLKQLSGGTLLDIATTEEG
ncbi:MAG: exodeoxyribonuclease VII small subunit [Anaerolineales bacterium]|nr:exodeoxyribonuclease VII small subunit [Anaerolineae bacterium]PWB55715.1 MAG: exodeoxyribonuclease VII small subunit [Anaerolineales bacterium]